MKEQLAVGLMSGTSLDGLDAVLIRADAGLKNIRVLVHHFSPYPPAWSVLARKIGEQNLLAESARFSAVWSEHAAAAVRTLLRKAHVPASRVAVIGAHGQTVLHAPHPAPFLGKRVGFTIQLADLSRLAVRTGIDVAGNFRTADVAAGGGGAPLAPHAHRILFGKPKETLAVQNFGGLGNVTLIRRGSVVLAFDTGPGNVWIDTTARWFSRDPRAFDRGGALAHRGKPDEKIARALCVHPFLKRRPPKSADWVEFGPAYLARFRRKLLGLGATGALATVTAATARATAGAYRAFVLPKAKPSRILVAGGGAFNPELLRLLSRELPKIPIRSTASEGIPPDYVEAVCFALLALGTVHRIPNNEPAATGARARVICGQIAPASTTVTP